MATANGLMIKFKAPWESLDPMGFRRCHNCGEMDYCKKHRRKPICQKCYLRKKR